jgi:hypothetical protein
MSVEKADMCAARMSERLRAAIHRGEIILDRGTWRAHEFVCAAAPAAFTKECRG